MDLDDIQSYYTKNIMLKEEAKKEINAKKNDMISRIEQEIEILKSKITKS